MFQVQRHLSGMKGFKLKLKGNGERLAKEYKLLEF
jgi:hypothetical protein